MSRTQSAKEQTILIVEDDPALMRGLVDNFQSHGYVVQAATDGHAGLAHALTARPSLIILDIMLPKMNGFEICRQVRKQKLDTPIVMLTAKGDEQDIVRGLELGANDYVTKPFGIRELLARVKALLRRGDHFEDSIITLGDMQFDKSSRKLTRNGREVLLTHKEYQLFEFFVTHRDRALTRQEILDKVWGGSLMATTRSIDRCVTTLRQKIESDPSRPTLVRTVREIGYRFEFPTAEADRENQ